MGPVPTTVKMNIFDENSDLTSHTIQVPNGTLEQYKTTQMINDGRPISPSQVWFGSDDTSLLEAFYE